jgi:hypothetical protein
MRRCLLVDHGIFAQQQHLHLWKGRQGENICYLARNSRCDVALQRQVRASAGEIQRDQGAAAVMRPEAPRVAGVTVRPGRLHYAWVVAGVTFAALLVAGGVRGSPGILVVPLETEFGWSRATISLVSFAAPRPMASLARISFPHASIIRSRKSPARVCWREWHFSISSAGSFAEPVLGRREAPIRVLGPEMTQSPGQPADYRPNDGKHFFVRSSALPSWEPENTSAKKAGESVDARTMLRSPGVVVG